jgi:hypothetical protein
MTEYFYTTQLGYADFAVKHGFEQPQAWTGIMTGWAEGLYGRENVGNNYRFHKTPHNVALMNKQEFDVVKQIGKTIAFNKVGIIEYGLNRKLIVRHSGFDDPHIDNWVINERNNIPFPVWDKEGV